MTYILLGFSVYFLYIVLVFAFCFFLEEVNASAWYIDIYKKYISCPSDNPPKNKLELARGLSIFPIAFLIQRLLPCFAVGAALFFIPIFDWLIIPVFNGKIPKIGFKKYFNESEIFDPEKKRKALFYFPPMLLLGILFTLFAVVHYLTGFDTFSLGEVSSLVIGLIGFLMLDFIVTSLVKWDYESTFFDNIFNKLRSQKLELE